MLDVLALARTPATPDMLGAPPAQAAAALTWPREAISTVAIVQEGRSLVHNAVQSRETDRAGDMAASQGFIQKLDRPNVQTVSAIYSHFYVESSRPKLAQSGLDHGNDSHLCRARHKHEASTYPKWSHRANDAVNKRPTTKLPTVSAAMGLP